MFKRKIPKLPLNEPEIPGWFALGELILLYEAVMQNKAKRCLEIGTFMGRSAFAICSALRDLGNDGHLTCIDSFGSPISKEYYEMEFMKTMMARYPDVRAEYSDYEKYPTTLDCFKLTMRRFPFMEQFVEIVAGDSLVVELGQELFDFILIDGDHTYDGVKKDFLRVRPHIREGGVICFHDDSIHFPGVQMFISEVRERADVALVGQAGTARCFRVSG